MNFKIVIKTVSIFIISLAVVMLVPFIVALIYHEPVWKDFLISSCIATFFGGLGFLLCRNTQQRIFRREGFAIVGFGWMIGSLFGSLPFIFADVMTMVDAYFETVSGFTTTGSTILTNIEILPKSILFWRSLTQWLGGMGIIVLFVAIVPFLGASGKQLFRSESSASSSDGIKPKIRETARRLWYIYLGLTIAEVILLCLGNVSFFDSLCHTFTTLATGGFSTYNTSIKAFGSAYVETVIIVFMIFAGINFFMLYSLFTGQIKKTTGISELKTYFMILFISTLMITYFLFQTGKLSMLESLRQSAFQVVSIMTTTGFITENYEVWPPFTKLLLVVLMFVGGCAGSTGGGMKVIRFQVAFKFMFNQIVKTIHPGAIKSVKVSNNLISWDNINEVLGFFILSFVSVVFFSLIMAALGLDVVSAFASVVATLWNIGPGLAQVGAIENFSFIPDAGKLVLSLCMILGRLEFFAIIVFFFPSFWKK